LILSEILFVMPCGLPPLRSGHLKFKENFNGSLRICLQGSLETKRIGKLQGRAMDTGYPEDEHSTRERLETAGGNLIRITLLFGSATIAVALVITHLLDNKISGNVQRPVIAQNVLDYGITSSVRTPERLTVRKSVLQASPDAVCVIRQDGSRTGDC
jgi:hypothetical protein